ncbi:unnamed protein product [Ixodes pacificus]
MNVSRSSHLAHIYKDLKIEDRRQKNRLREARNRPGVVARSCNPASRRPGSGTAPVRGLGPAPCPCRQGVRAKRGVDMAGPGEPGAARSPKEERTGPGRKRSRQKLPRPAVVGSRPGTGHAGLPGQGVRTWTFLAHL